MSYNGDSCYAHEVLTRSHSSQVMMTETKLVNPAAYYYIPFGSILIFR